jgi:hypothetical protein
MLTVLGKSLRRSPKFQALAPTPPGTTVSETKMTPLALTKAAVEVPQTKLSNNYYNKKYQIAVKFEVSTEVQAPQIEYK